MIRALVLSLVLLSAAPLGQAQDEAFELRPRYTAGFEREVDARLTVLLRLRLTLPSANIDRTSEQEQVARRHFREKVLEASKGALYKVRRRYVSMWEGERPPGASNLQRKLSPLSGKSLEVWWDTKRDKRRARLSNTAHVVPSKLLDAEPLRERWDLVLPKDGVVVGQRWKVKDKDLRRALGPKLAESGSLECRLVAVREEAIDKRTPPERYAVVSLKVRTQVKEKGSGAVFTTQLTGKLRLSLARRQIASIELRGTATLTSTRTEGDHVLTIHGTGPLELRKRVWFPSKPRRVRKPKKKSGE
jgi:hypothetical protein